MSILKLMRDRQMYKYGQRVAKSLDGSRPGYGGPQDRGDQARGTGAYDGGPPGNSGDQSTDRSRVSSTQQANHDKAQADRAEAIANPSMFEKVTNFYKSGGLPGMAVRGLTGLYDRVTGPPDLGIRDGYNMANIAGPRSFDFGPGPGEGNDNQGIMAAYNPNMLNVSGEVVDEVPVSQEEEDFKQRFRVANEFRQDKQGQLDPAILEMISKLYT